MKHLDTSSADSLCWQKIGWVILCIRFVQGWIFWGGGSRRLIYAPQKLAPYSPQWMANKLQAAMPGSLFDLNQLVSFLLQHFTFLYITIIVFSLMELLSGLGLILGFFTRAMAMVTVLISISLMILFGWQGTTCLDEWTMAVSNLSMRLTLVLTGGMVCSLDALLIRRYPNLLQKYWFMLFGSTPWPLKTIKRVGIGCFVFTVIFTLGTYNYYRGAIFSPYHPGPVSADLFHLSLSEGSLQVDGSVHFTMYVNGGPSAAAMYIIRVELLNSARSIVEDWLVSELRTLPQTAIHNIYAYNKINIGFYGLIAPESAKAEINLPSTLNKKILPPGQYNLQIYTVDGQRWDLPIRFNNPR